MKKHKIPTGFLSRVLCCILIAHVLFSGATNAQNNPDSTHIPNYWFNVGLGASTSGISLGTGFSHQVGSSGHISVRLTYNAELSLFVSPGKSVLDFGILSGRCVKMSNGFATISTGISFVDGVNRGELLSSDWFSSEYEKIHFSTIGIPFEGQLFWAASDEFGIGVYVFANINPEKSFYGALVCIRVGQLK